MKYNISKIVAKWIPLIYNLNWEKATLQLEISFIVTVYGYMDI